MSKCVSIIRELRFVIEDELTRVFVHVEASGDCPIGVQGWHSRTFPASKPAIRILAEDVPEHLLWPLEAPLP